MLWNKRRHRTAKTARESQDVWPPIGVPCTRRVPHFGVSSVSTGLSERRMNNLRVCNGLDGSIPTAPTKLQQTKDFPNAESAN
jgi:hypothetical protein